MSPDDPAPLEPFTDPALEARIVALILGEASDYERGELERAMADEPALAALHNRLSGVHDILSSSESKETQTEDDGATWKLSEERRATVLERIKSEPQAPALETAAASGE